MSWELFVQGVIVFFFLDWIFFIPLFPSLFAKEKGFAWQIPEQKYLILLPSMWLFCIIGAFFSSSFIKILFLISLWFIFRKYFISNRWKSVRRGCGAPGLMSYWSCSYIVIIETLKALDISGELAKLAIYLMKFDFSLIILCAGLYKSKVGFFQGEGMEYGRVNPIWGYHWKRFSNGNPAGWYPVWMNGLASSVEIVGGSFLLVPFIAFQLVGALLVSLSFVYVSFFIRLGRLSALMAYLPFMYLPSVHESFNNLHQGLQCQEILKRLIQICLISYAFVLPIVKINQYYNLFFNKSFPKLLQLTTNFLTAHVPVIMWRVFTPDLINFYCRIKNSQNKYILDEKIYSKNNWQDFLFKNRMLHVCESIALASVFTTLKYFPSKRYLFEEKLVRWVKSILSMNKNNESKVFVEYISIQKEKSRFKYKHTTTYEVCTVKNSVLEIKIDPDFRPEAICRFSPIRESKKHGSYERK